MVSLTRNRKTYDPRLVKNARTTGASASVKVPEGRPHRSFEAVLSGTGVISAKVDVEVCNDDTNWQPLATISLSTGTKLKDGFKDDGAWTYVRGNVTEIIGTNAAVSLTMGI